MSKLEDLRKLIADSFDAAESKEQIDKLSQMKTLVDDAVEEEKHHLQEKSELLASYKKAVKFSVVKDENPSVKDQVHGDAPDFNKLLQDAILKDSN